MKYVKCVIEFSSYVKLGDKLYESEFEGERVYVKPSGDNTPDIFFDADMLDKQNAVELYDGDESSGFSTKL